MSEDEPSDLPPYTGRAQAVASEALVAERSGAAPRAPRVRWRRITLVHLLAGAVMGFAIPALFFLGSGLLTSNVPGYLPILVISAIVVSLIGGGLPLLAAWLTWLVVSRARRGLGREVAAVAGGALIGSVPIGLLAAGAFNSWEPTLIVGLLFGVPCAIAFAIWLLVAWRRAPKGPENSLN